jgi:pyridoxine/pyridoxamine 5'-phosphate oxidase
MMQSDQSNSTTRANFLDDVAAELEQARAVHAPIHSAHEGYSVILEELEEFWNEVKRKRHERDPEVMWAELVQVAAMAARTAEDVLVWSNP